MNPTEPTLQVKWRNTLYKIPISTTPTLALLKSHLETLTKVPPSRQTLLSASFTRPPQPDNDNTPLLKIFRNNLLPPRPIMLIGTPVPRTEPPIQDQSPTPQVQNDLHELSAPPAPPSPPTPSPPPSPPPHNPPIENPSATNGATLSLATLSTLLTPTPGPHPPLHTHLPPTLPTPPWQTTPSLRDAITVAKCRLQLIAILLLNPPVPPSTPFLHAAATPGTLLADTLRQSYTVLPVDMTTLPSAGTPLLQRLGLHAVPAVFLLADLGAGPVVVDMFNVGFVGDPQTDDGVHKLGARLQTALLQFDGFFDAARARRVASDGRAALIREQDDAVERARLADEEQRAREVERERREARKRQEGEDERRRAEREAESAREMLPDEPERGDARVAVRLPDGRRVERAFGKEDVVRDVFNFCVAQGVPRGRFLLVVGFSRRLLEEEVDGSVSLESAGFVPSVTLNVDLV